jgi:3-phenylpropionate/trans-cinnamate dioxygenase ferredoxin subunit
MERSVAKTTEIAPETTHKVTVDGIAVLICNAGGEFYAIEDVCTHDGGELDQGTLDGCEIECPRHGARFDVRTGAALTLPAFEPVRSFPLRIDGDDIYIEV